MKMFDRNARIEDARLDLAKAKELKRKKISVRFTGIAPLGKAKVTKRDVMAFWAKQHFDLGLHPVEGNCDLCPQKGKKALKALIRRAPERAEWWIKQEAIKGFRFAADWKISDLLSEVRAQGDIFDGFLPDIEHDVECGLFCESEAARQAGQNHMEGGGGALSAFFAIRR